MPHRIDAVRLGEVTVAKSDVVAAVTRLQAIETLMTGSPTAAQTKEAIGDLAKFVRKLIRVIV